MTRQRKHDLEIEACEHIQNVYKKSEKTKSHNTPVEESNTAKDRGRPRFSTSGWEGGKDNHRAEKRVRRGGPILGHIRQRGKEVARKSLTSSMGQQLPPWPDFHIPDSPLHTQLPFQAHNQSHFHSPHTLLLGPQTHHPLFRVPSSIPQPSRIMTDARREIQLPEREQVGRRSRG